MIFQIYVSDAKCLIFSGEFPAAIQGCPGRPHLDAAILILALLLLLLAPQQDHPGPHLLPLVVLLLLLLAPQVHLDFQAFLGPACQLVPIDLISTSVASHLPLFLLPPNSLLDNDPTM